MLLPAGQPFALVDGVVCVFVLVVCAGGVCVFVLVVCVGVFDDGVCVFVLVVCVGVFDGVLEEPHAASAPTAMIEKTRSVKNGRIERILMRPPFASRAST
jgi:hypothetical protein